MLWIRSSKNPVFQGSTWTEPHEEKQDTVRGVGHDVDSRSNKRRKLIAQGRFGDSGIEADGKGIELFNVRLEDPLSGTPGTSSSLSINIDGDEPGEDSEHQKGGKNAKEGNRDKPWGSLFGSEHDLEPHLDLQTWRPDVRLTFQGTHVFACVRKLVDSGDVEVATINRTAYPVNPHQCMKWYVWTSASER
ncbi:MAG: hypothetical protein M1839_006113 [Geoglossum umbratile]|nr:MAG: hypothetical protein M1839_006113 [Geoglossum umbratile]